MLDQPSNNQRASRANTAISAVAVETGSDDDQAALITDLLSDLRHLCDAESLDFDVLSGVAYRNYAAEIHDLPVADADYAGGEA